MASAPKERPAISDEDKGQAVIKKNEQIKRESSAQYRSSIETINRAQDRDIERALRNH